MAASTPRLLSIKVHSQLSEDANALGVAEGTPTMLCGWFATALAGMACERIPASGRLPLVALLQLIRDMRSVEAVIPRVRDRLRATRAWRNAYIEHHAGEFKPADVAAGGPVAPTDPATVRGFSESCAGCWEVADLLRSAAPATPAAGIAFLRQAMWTPETAVYYTESAEIACERAYLEEEAPFRVGGPRHAPDYAPYFLDLPTGNPLVEAHAASSGSGSGAVPLEPVAAIEHVRRPGVMLGLDALATVAGAGAAASVGQIPRVYVADLFGHFVCAIAVEVEDDTVVSDGHHAVVVPVEELLRDPALADIASANGCMAVDDAVSAAAAEETPSSGAAAAAAAPAVEAPQKPAVPLRAGRYVIAFETLPTRNGETDYVPVPSATASAGVDAFGLAPSMGFMQALSKAVFGQPAPPEACCTYPLVPAIASDKHS